MLTQKYKQQQQQVRVQTSESNYAKGMFFSDAPLAEGYSKTLVNWDIDETVGKLTPRKGLRTIDYAISDTKLLPSGHYNRHNHNLVKYIYNTTRDSIVSKDFELSKHLLDLYYMPSTDKAYLLDLNFNIDATNSNAVTDKLNTVSATPFNVLKNGIETKVIAKEILNSGIHGLRTHAYLSDVYNVYRPVATYAYNNSVYLFVDTYKKVNKDFLKKLGEFPDANALYDTVTKEWLFPTQGNPGGYYVFPKINIIVYYNYSGSYSTLDMSEEEFLNNDVPDNIMQTVPVLCYTKQGKDIQPDDILFDTTINKSNLIKDHWYVCEVDPQKLNPTEAASWGYNMLLEDPYKFKCEKTAANVITILGIVPYDNSGQITLTPRKNQDITLKAYYRAPDEYYTDVARGTYYATTKQYLEITTTNADGSTTIEKRDPKTLQELEEYNGKTEEIAASYSDYAFGSWWYCTDEKQYYMVVPDTSLTTKKLDEPSTTKPSAAVLLAPTLSAATKKEIRVRWQIRTVDSSDWIDLYNEKLSLNGKDKEHQPFTITTTMSSDELLVKFTISDPSSVDELTKEETVITTNTIGLSLVSDELATTLNLKPIKYNLGTCSGMCEWEQRIVLWGVEGAENTLFVSDVNNPTFFPYPNNVDILPDPILKVFPYGDELLALTATALYRLTWDAEGTGWTHKLVQRNLNVTQSDLVMCCVLKNMFFFKSGEYYYMMVPKSSSVIGESTIAPISKPIEGLLDNFHENVYNILDKISDGLKYKEYTVREIYDENGEYVGLDRVIEQHTYSLEQFKSNFIDYFVHTDGKSNIIAQYTYMVYVPNNANNTYINVQLKYNIDTRVWSMSMFETPRVLSPIEVSTLQEPQYIYEFSRGSSNITHFLGGNIGETYKGDTRAQLAIATFSDVNLKDITQNNITHTIDTVDVPLEYGDGIIMCSDNITKLHEDSSGNVYYTYEHTLYYAKKYFSDVYNEERYQHAQAYFLNNYQFLDTGNRDINTDMKKRFREFQFKMRNVNATSLGFHTSFLIDGSLRRDLQKYTPRYLTDPSTGEMVIVIERTLDEASINYLSFVPAYKVTRVEYAVASTKMLQDDGELTPTTLAEYNDPDKWVIDQSAFPGRTFWKVRVSISGKGYTPRAQLLSTNLKYFEVFGHSWVYRTMHGR